MLRVPQKMLRNWSDYRGVVTDVDALLKSYINREPALDVATLNLTKVDALGWQSRTAHQLYRATCDELTEWCITHKRYLNSVSGDQWIAERSDADLHQTPILRHSKLQILGNRIDRLRATWLPRPADLMHADAPKLKTQRLHGAIPSWCALAHEFVKGEMILIDAPLCRGPAPENSLFLCDYPSLSRRADHERIRLLISGQARHALEKFLHLRGHWHPFCRVLGLVHEGSNGGAALQVLHIAMRNPPCTAARRRKNPVQPGLMDEATSRTDVADGVVSPAGGVPMSNKLRRRQRPGADEP